MKMILSFKMTMICAAWAIAMTAQATVTISLKTAGWGDETGIRNELAWGIVVDSDGNAVNGGFDEIFLRDLAAALDGFSLPDTSVFADPVRLFDEYYFVRSRSNTVNSWPGGADQDGYMNDLGLIFDAPVGAGDDYALIWFSTASGTLSDSDYFGFQALGVLPGDGYTITVDSSPGLATEDIGSAVVPQPEISLFDGSGTNAISNGDNTPSAEDGTDFGAVAVASGVEARTFLLRNPGDGPLQITGASVVDSSEFALNGLASSIDAGASDAFELVFDPDTPGSRSATIRLETNDPDGSVFTFAVSGEGIDEATTWYDAAIDLSGDWRYFDWFGSFNVSQDPWIYHAQHGWLFPFADGPESVYFWDGEMESILWTSESVYPAIYRFSDGQWLFYEKGSSNPRLFVNLVTGQWEQW